MIDKFISNKYIKFFILVCITVIGCRWIQYFYPLPWGINSAMSAIGFFAFGRYFKESKCEKGIREYINGGCNNKVIYFFIVIILLVVFSILILKNDKINIRVGYYGIARFSYFFATCFSILLFVFFYLIELFFDLKRHTIFSILLNIGNNSIIYLCINHPALNISKYLINLFDLNLSGILIVVLEFFIAMAIMMFLVKCIRKTSLKTLFCL